MNSDFKKRFPLVSILLKPSETLPESEFFDLLNSLTDEAITQLMGELIVLSSLIELIELLSPEQIKSLSMMANYKNN